MDGALVATSSLAAAAAAVGAMATCFPQALAPLALMVGLPMAIYGIIALLEMMIVSTKRSWMQQRRRQAPRRVLELSRVLYEQLDGELLELLMSNRNFDSNDYERLMRLEAMNGRPTVGATLQQVQQLPVVTVTASMVQASENASCPVCLSAFQVHSHVRLLPCFHRFHLECIDPWLLEKPQCPVCKFSAIV
uniref:RING-type domain-containing protein n=1 Tax=Peronospora matthiolae TaxID=2874970 RepID=A0AAV1UKP6_9STRA